MLGKLPNRRPGISKNQVFWLVILSLCLAGCTNLIDFENNQVQNQDVVGGFGAEDTLGQTFLIRREPLTGIQLWLREAEPGSQPTGVVTFTLAPTEDPSAVLYAGQINRQDIARSFPILIKFPQIPLEIGQQYQITLSADSGLIRAHGTDEDMYPGGYAYTSNAPLVGDLAFRLEYEYSYSAAWEDFQTILSLFFPISIIFAVLLMPGWIMLRTIRSSWSLELVTQLGLMVGLSLAIIAVVMQWSSVVGISWNRTGVLLVFLVTGILIVSVELIHRRHNSLNRTERSQLDEHGLSGINIRGVAYLILLILSGTLFVRFAMVRDLSAPAWVDPVHHTLINRMIVQDGMLPDTFLPYADALAENYHTGYHSASAVVTWLTGLDYLNTQLIFGQVLNAVCILTVYLLAYSLTGSLTAAIAASLLTGFVTPMPAYYTSWGRYTQLAGLLILPAAFVFTRSLYTKNPRLPEIHPVNSSKPAQVWKTVLLASILLAGAFFVHIRVVVFLVSIIVIDFLLELAQNRKDVRFHMRTISLHLGAVMLLSIILSAPLLIRIIGDVLPQRVSDWNTGDPGSFSLAWQFLTAGSGRISLVLAVLGLLIAIYFHTRLAATLLAWAGLMLFFAYAPQLGIPINGIVSSDSVMITLFLPISIAGGYAIHSLRRIYLQSEIPAAQITGEVMLGAFGILLIFFGARSILPIINPVTVYFKQADREAASWVDENLPPEAKILINPAPWGYSMYVGSDGGYWISPLTGRVTFPPTLLYAHGPSSSYTVINRQVRELIELTDSPPELAQYMQQGNLDYLYLGAQGGPISPQQIVQSPEFELIYHEGGVWIFRPQGTSQTID
jgi:hypothetical protein